MDNPRFVFGVSSDLRDDVNSYFASPTTQQQEYGRIRQILTKLLGPGLIVLLDSVVDDLKGFRMGPVFSAESVAFITSAYSRNSKLKVFKAAANVEDARNIILGFIWIEFPRKWIPFFETLKMLISNSYIEYPTPLPDVAEKKDDELFAHEDYLQPAPLGVDARAAWKKIDEKKACVAFADVEEGWTPAHLEFASKYFCRRGHTRGYARAHGTAVLGIVCADDNAGDEKLPAVGLAPYVKDILLSSYIHEWPKTPEDGDECAEWVGTGTKADAIAYGAKWLHDKGAGNVLLIETQASVDNDFLLPVEIQRCEFIAIRAAVDLGVIVVEAGGNGRVDTGANVNLDEYMIEETVTTESGEKRVIEKRYPLAPNRPGFRDSGAIIVSAVSTELPHRRLFFAPEGNRIDVWAHGEQVVTTNSDTKAVTDIYTGGFSGTSAAAAIVAGVAILVQSALDSKPCGTRLTPAEMREVLKHMGTDVLDDRGNKPIGVMPDLAEILKKLKI